MVQAAIRAMTLSATHLRATTLKTPEVIETTKGVTRFLLQSRVYPFSFLRLGHSAAASDFAGNGSTPRRRAGLRRRPSRAR